MSSILLRTQSSRSFMCPVYTQSRKDCIAYQVTGHLTGLQGQQSEPNEVALAGLESQEHASDLVSVTAERGGGVSVVLCCVAALRRCDNWRGSLVSACHNSLSLQIAR